MKYLDESIYRNLMDAYFKQATGVQLFGKMTKLDHKEDDFIIKAPYADTVEKVTGELQGPGEPVEIGEGMLEEDDFLSFINSGFFDKNPALIHFSFESADSGTTRVKMRAYGAEGLIKQKTCRKALDKVKAHFNQQSV